MRAPASLAVVCAPLSACALVSGCGGGTPKRGPSQSDIAAIATSVSDIVYQCQSAAAGFTAGVDERALTRDVDRLVSAAKRVEPDAPFAVGSSSGPRRRTTLRQQVALAARDLGGDCSRAQAARLRDALKR